MPDESMTPPVGEPPKVAVVTPYHREDLPMLRRAHDSVLAQDMACTHVLVADGFARPEIDAWDCQHIKLPEAHGDGGAFGRGIGGLHAVSRGFDYVAFLDADCWFDADHLSSLVETARRTGCRVVTSARRLIRLDGTLLSASDEHSDGDRFADTSTMMLHRDASDLLALSARLPPETGAICDQLLWMVANIRKHRSAHSDRATLNFTTRYAVHYRQCGEEPPPGTIDLSGVFAARQHWNSLGDEAMAALVRGAPRQDWT